MSTTNINNNYLLISVDHAVNRCIVWVRKQMLLTSKGKYMYFAQLTKNIGTVSNPVRETTYWSFESLQQRNSAVINIPSCYEDFKNNIPKGTIINKFSHFTETYSGLFLILN